MDMLGVGNLLKCTACNINNWSWELMRTLDVAIMHAGCSNTTFWRL